MRRICKSFVNCTFVFFYKAPVIAQVRCQIIVHLGRAVFDCFFHINHGRKFFDIDNNCLCSIAGLRCTIGDNRRNGVSHMTHFALRQNGMRRFLHRLAVTVCHLPSAGKPADTLKIRTGKNAHNAGHGCRSACVDTVDPSMRHRRAQEMNIGLSLNVDIVCVLASAS